MQEACLRAMHLLDFLLQKIDDTKCSTLLKTTCEATSNAMLGNTPLPSPYAMAMQNADDLLIPVKGHGIIALTKLIDKRDRETLAHSRCLLALFIKFVHDSDSYIYLAAINGLISLSAVPSARDLVISTLCQEYAQKSSPPFSSQDTAGKLDSGRYTAPNVALPLSGCTAIPIDHGAKSCETSNLRKLDVEMRIKIGEALVKVSQLCGDFLPHYLDQVTAAIFSNTRDPEPLIRASSLSNLADLCAGVKLSFRKVQVEVNVVSDCDTSTVT